MSRFIGALDTWCNRNRLILNINKTVRINFHSTGGLALSNNQVECRKFLGIYVDSKFNWAKQIDYIVSKINKSFYATLNILMVKKLSGPR